jgi:serine O-acetyltransferase
MTPIEKQIESVVDGILLDYQNGRDIDKLELYRHPSKEIIIDMIGKLIRLIYPGYALERTYWIYNAKHNLSMLIEDVMYNLSKQISLVLQANMEESAAEEQAQRLSLEFLGRIPQVRAVVQTDVEAAYDGDPAATDMAEIIFSYPGLFAITVYRLAHVLHTLKVPMLPRIMTEHAHSVTGIDIHPGATIGKFFFIDHGTGIVIGETTVIGENVKIYQGVTLGALSTRGGQTLRGAQRHPTIEDDVTIYAGASILGGQTVIGAGSTIGSNVFITESVAPGTSVRNKKQELQFKTVQ